MRNKYNTLHKFIFEYSDTTFRKETIEGLFRSVLEPVISNQKLEAYILLRLNDCTPFSSILKRLEFSSSKILSYSDFYGENMQKEDIWGDTEFVTVLGKRYSACLIWDYSSTDNGNSSNICLLFNSKVISDITKVISDNSKIDLKDILNEYSTDRRENLTLKTAVMSICSQLEEANRDLLSVEREKSNLLLSDDTVKTAEIVADKAKFIAHEIKNNLSVINLYTKIIEKHLEKISLDTEVKSSMDNCIKNINNASENASALISDLRCLSSPYLTEFPLKRFIEDTIALCAEKADKAGVDIIVDEIENITVKSDRVKLQCVLTNIIFNAIEACDKGCKVKLNVVLNDNIADIFIENNGQKIPDEIKDKIFEPDFTTKKTGNGLGLAVCKRQMKMLNGDVSLVSTGDTTVFKMSFVY